MGRKHVCVEISQRFLVCAIVWLALAFVVCCISAANDASVEPRFAGKAKTLFQFYEASDEPQWALKQFFVNFHMSPRQAKDLFDFLQTNNKVAVKPNIATSRGVGFRCATSAESLLNYVNTLLDVLGKTQQRFNKKDGAVGVLLQEWAPNAIEIRLWGSKFVDADGSMQWKWDAAVGNDGLAYDLPLAFQQKISRACTRAWGSGMRALALDIGAESWAAFANQDFKIIEVNGAWGMPNQGGASETRNAASAAAAFVADAAKSFASRSAQGFQTLCFRENALERALKEWESLDKTARTMDTLQLLLS